MRVPKPYFLENPEWYQFDEKNCRYVLTDKATDKAKESYAEYYSKIESNIVEE